MLNAEPTPAAVGFPSMRSERLRLSAMSCGSRFRIRGKCRSVAPPDVSADLLVRDDEAAETPPRPPTDLRRGGVAASDELAVIAFRLTARSRLSRCRA